jgi:flagellar FliJ protein
MPRFRFRLERVLSVRRHEEERDRIAFALATQRKELAERTLVDVRERISRAIENASVVASGRPTIEDFVRSHEYRLALLRKEEEAFRAVASMTAALDQARARLVEARRKRQVLERLREKSREKWRLEEESLEQNELDEIGLATHVRTRGSEAA